MRLTEGLLFGVSPVDPVTYGAVAILLIAIALLASYLPARKAAGVKLVLGADPQMVRRRIFSSSIIVVAAGAAVGMVCALIFGDLMESLLYGVSSRDAATLIAAPVVLLAAATLAIGVPVFRLTRVDPVDVLRTE